MSWEAGKNHAEDPAGVGFGEGGSADLADTRQDTARLQAQHSGRPHTDHKAPSCSLAFPRMPSQ